MANSKQMADYLSRQLFELQSQVGKLSSHVLRKENALLKKEMDLKGQPSAYSPSPITSLDARTRLPYFLGPGNVGEINKIVWPFWFTTGKVEVAPNEQQSSNFSVTQEAAFIAMAYTKTVFLKTTVPSFNVQYIDPSEPALVGKAEGLKFSFRDVSSTREFMGRSMDVDHIGDPRFPTELLSPMLILPRSNIEVSFTNSSAASTYITFLTFFGYRVRIEDAEDILSTVSE